MANPIIITVPHKLSRGEAKARVQESVEHFKQQLVGVGMAQVTHVWTHNRLDLHARAMGQAVTGHILVNDHDLRIEIELPGILGAFAGKIAGRLHHAGTLLLEKK
jgi:hypothetical protein